MLIIDLGVISLNSEFQLSSSSKSQIWINILGQIFATRKAGVPISNILLCWPDQYGSIDTSNTHIRPLVIILWHNILGQPQVAQNSLLTTLLINFFIGITAAALYYIVVELEKI